MKKISLIISLVLLWSNIGWADEKYDDLTDSQIKTILEKLEDHQKTVDFLQCVEIVRGSKIKRRFLRHQIKKIKCRLKYEELNANYKKEVDINIDIEKDTTGLAAKHKVMNIPHTVVIKDGITKAETGRLNEIQLKNLILN